MTAATHLPNSAADFAERALVGALLRDSGRVRDVRDWLRPHDLNHWKARSIYQTLADLHRQGRSVPVQDLPGVITAGTDRDRSPGVITAVDLHTYMTATPAVSPPAGSDHVHYGRIVLETAARHAVAVAGSRIQEATEQSWEHPDLGTGSIHAALAQTQQRLQVLGERLRHSQGHPGSLITAALGGPVADLTTLSGNQHTPAADPGALRPGTPAPPLTTRAVIEAEREVLSTCLTDPATRAELLDWLTPGDFSRPEHAATWAAFGALDSAGTPIDYVTVAWQCERHNPAYGSPGLSPDQLATMAQQPPGSPGPAVDTVAHASLLRHTETARQHVQAISDDPAANALTVVNAAQDAYQQVGQHAHRLTGTTPAVSRVSAALDSRADTRPGTTPPSPTPPLPPPHEPHRDPRRGR